jgi:hypothetical protein
MVFSQPQPKSGTMRFLSLTASLRTPVSLNHGIRRCDDSPERRGAIHRAPDCRSRRIVDLGNGGRNELRPYTGSSYFALCKVPFQILVRG